MIQFNLLPDVKVAYIKAKKAKRVVMVVAGLSVAVSLTLLGLMVSAAAYQRHHISDLNKDIKSYEASLNGTKDLAKILTIQNQLNSLPGLYSQRPVTSRFYNYLQATTPSQISIAKMDLEFTANSLQIVGTADSLETVNRYIDTLKFTTYTATGSQDKKNAFSQVVLTSFNRDSKVATFTTNLLFDPGIFDSSKTVKLNVPKTITTRSETELPGSNSGVFDTKGTN
jgi:Tfp pilus assembly protein PilN